MMIRQYRCLLYLMYQSIIVSAFTTCLIFSSIIFTGTSIAENVATVTQPEPYCQWQVENFAIEKPLCNLVGDPQRGKLVVTDSDKGNCLACHHLPIEGIEAYGTIGPPLEGVGVRLSEGFIRLRVVDTRNIIPMSIMPGFYRDPTLINRPRKDFEGRTFLTAQQVEDVIAYLVTLQ